MRVALTGGVGCGVSEVARRLQEKGFTVVFADEIGHRILRFPEVKRALLRRFGRSIFAAAPHCTPEQVEDGEIDRIRLANIVFAEAAARRDLDRLIHPVLLDILKREARKIERACGIAVVDAALVFEWNLQSFFHQVIVIAASLEERIRRVMRRNGLSRPQVLQRIAAQWALERKVELADFVIDNNGSLEQLHRCVDDLARDWRRLLKKK